MGLDTSHDCWHGSYGRFNNWRIKLCEISGYGKLEDYCGFGGEQPWPETDPLTILLSHSDCDGEIDHKNCLGIAKRLEELLPSMKIADGNLDYKWYECGAQQFINGLKKAASLKENVDFH